MTTEVSDTDSSELNEQPAESIAVAEPSAQRLTSHTQDDISNLPQPEEISQIETSSPRAHENNEKLFHDLQTVRNFIHKITTLLQEFLTSLNEKEETNISPHITTQQADKPLSHSHPEEMSKYHLPQEIHDAIETSAKQPQDHKYDTTPQYYNPRSNPILHKSLMQQVHNLQKQIGKLHRLQTTQEAPQRNSHRKPETRICFRCAKSGHVAKFCRSKLLSTKSFQTHQRTHLFRKQSPIRQPYHQQLRNFGYNSSEYDPINNWQSSPRCSSKISSPDTTQPDL